MEIKRNFSTWPGMPSSHVVLGEIVRGSTKFSYVKGHDANLGRLMDSSEGLSGGPETEVIESILQNGRLRVVRNVRYDFKPAH